MVVSHGVGMSRVIKEREGERVAGGSGRAGAGDPTRCGARGPCYESMNRSHGFGNETLSQ